MPLKFNKINDYKPANEEKLDRCNSISAETFTAAHNKNFDLTRVHLLCIGNGVTVQKYYGQKTVWNSCFKFLIQASNILCT